MPDDDVYVPLHAGAEGKESLGYLPDNTGDHISSKNPSYCELTGLYWAWKIWTVNISVSAITEDTLARVFIQKYRQEKEAIFHREDYENLLQTYDVLLPKREIII